MVTISQRQRKLASCRGWINPAFVVPIEKFVDGMILYKAHTFVTQAQAVFRNTQSRYNITHNDRKHSKLTPE